MKWEPLYIVIIAFLFGAFTRPELSAADPASSPGWQVLFNGKDLKGWDIVIGQRGPTRVNEDPDKIFQVHDGMVHTYKDTEDKSKVQYGYFLTKKKYSHYHLRFEFKWGKKKFQPRLKAPRDAGVLYHVVGERIVWPRSLELQVEENGMGDFLTVYGAQAKSTVDPESIDKLKKGNARFRLPSEGGVPFVSGGPKVYWVYRYPQAVKEGWNTFELIVRGDKSAEHRVNGIVVNRVTDLKQLDKDGESWIPLKAGKILFQAEAAEAYYRNIEIKELPVSGKQASGEKVFRAGAFAIDITPKKFPVPISGSILGSYTSTVLDRLHARCLVLDDGSSKIALVVVDSLMISREIADKAKALAHQSTGIDINKIMISATHTHSAPTTIPCHASEPDPDYVELLIHQIAEGIKKAHSHLEPAKIGWGMGEDKTNVFIRRYLMKEGSAATNPFGGTKNDRAQMNPGHTNPKKIRRTGPSDPGVAVLSVQSIKGRPIALFSNYSTHYVGSNPISADYFSIFCNKIAKKIKADKVEPAFVGLLSNGTSGDANCVDFNRTEGRKFDKTSVAEDIAEVAYRVYQKIDYYSWVPLVMEESLMTLPIRKPTQEEVVKAKAIFKTIPEGKPRSLVESYVRETVLIDAMPRTREFKLQAIRIGHLGITALPNEAYGSTGLTLKKKSPMEITFNIGLANGYEGYLPPPDQHELGGYTTWRARTSILEVQAEPKIVSGLIELLNKVHKRKSSQTLIEAEK